jgi:hypothetical protein
MEWRSIIRSLYNEYTLRVLAASIREALAAQIPESAQKRFSKWRKRVGVEPTQDRQRPLPGLKSGRPTGSDSLPLPRNQAVSY